MSRLAGFYIAAAIHSAAAGKTAAAASGMPPRRPGNHTAPAASRGRSCGRSVSPRVAAAVHRFIGGLAAASGGRRRIAHLPSPEPTRQPSAH
jgi:hypothetical protein